MIMLHLKNKSNWQFLLPLMVGLAAFFAIVGTRALDPTNIFWLRGGFDPTQHYLGWAIFREGPWTFPIGLNPNYGMEYSNAIVFSDSIPLFAFLFKLFSAWLPSTFQYIGLWTLACLVLQAWFAWKLIGLMSDSVWIRILATCIFVFSPPMMYRIGVHSALAGHFLILAALYLIFFARDKNRLISWTLLICTAALVHFYLLVMVLCLWFASMMDRALGRGFQVSVPQVIQQIAIVFISLLLVMWQAGYFSVQAGSASAGGYGVYRLNLLSPIDSRSWSYLLKPIPMEPDDGYSYFGLGGLVLVCCSFFLVFTKRVNLIQYGRFYRFLIVALIALTLFAITNSISAGVHNFTFQLPEKVFQIASYLRASGRMFWPAYYCIFLVMVFCIIRGVRKRTAIYILGVVCVLQIVDTSAGWLPLRERLMSEKASEFKIPMKNSFWTAAPKRYSNLIVLPVMNAPNEWDTYTAYAAQNQMATNAAFLARVDERKVVSANDKYKTNLEAGHLDAKNLYIIPSWKQFSTVIKFDPEVDLLAKIDGYVVLAPGWNACSTCPPVSEDLRLNRLAPITKINQPIYFSQKADGRREFLLSGWFLYGEAWGTWSDSGVAKLILPVPAGNPRFLELEGRALVNGNHPMQAMELWIDGVLQEKVSLTRFEGNRIRLNLSPSTLSKEYFILELKFPNRVSPKSIGMGPDERLLGFGLVAAEFK
jgi:hypothetical protein